MKLLVFILLVAHIASAGTAKLTIKVNTSDDSTAVANFAAVLYDASGIKLDSLVSVSSDQIIFLNVSTGIGESSNFTPVLFDVLQNYPNPFNPSTRIRFSLPHPENIDFRIYDILGRVITSYNSHLNAGTHELEWTPNAAAGVYLYMLKAGDFSQSKKMVLEDGFHGSNQLKLISSSKGNSYYSDKVIANSGNIKSLPKTAGANYSVRIINLPTTTPQIGDTVIQITNLENNRIVNVYLQRILKSASLNPISNFTMEEDRPPVDSLVALLHGIGYDKNGILIPETALTYQVLNQTNQALIDLKTDKNKVKIKSLLQRGNGHSDVTVRIVAPNGKYADAGFGVDVSPVQDLIANFTDYFRNISLTDRIFVKTSLDSGYIAPNKSFRISSNAENVEVSGPNVVGRVFAIPAGTQDVTLNDFLANADTSKLGIDKNYFMVGALNRLNGPFPTNKTVAMTQESLKDTIWVYGNFEDVLPGLSLGFRTVEQLNTIAKMFNETAKELTTTKNYQNGLFGIDKQIIVIADDNFNKPDSIAKFAYSNMVAMPTSGAPPNSETGPYFVVWAKNISGGNGTNYMQDGLIIRGEI